jgi:hypothetical protein
MFEMLDNKNCKNSCLNSFVTEFPNGGKIYKTRKKSLRLNVFKGVSVPKTWSNWIVKKNMVWIKNCPLPEDEVFMKL